MARFTPPDHNQRIAAARAAKQSALEQLRNKPEPDPERVAARQAKLAAQEAAAAERRAAHRREQEEAKAAKLAAKEAAAQAAAAEAKRSVTVLPTAAELKAARDARYAARKARRK